MKTSKKITIAALSAATALVGATGAVSVSSFAWFAMNGTVTATGMSVLAKSTDAYLQIGDAGEKFNETSNSYTTATATSTEKSLTPTHLFDSVDTAKTDGTEYTGGADRVWVTGHSDTVDSATLSGEFTTVTIGETYALINEFQLRLRPAQNGSVTAVEKLSVAVEFSNSAELNSDSLKNAVSVLVSSGDDARGQLFEYDGSKFAPTAGTENVDVVTNLTEGVQRVKIYFFFDGQDANCTSANVVAERKYSVNVTFTIPDKN